LIKIVSANPAFIVSLRILRIDVKGPLGFELAAARPTVSLVASV
jgi:hypothetical protein